MEFVSEREMMVKEQVQRRGITEPRLLSVLRRVPRDRFVKLVDLPHAYEDHPLQIGEGQTISQPFIVALMTTLLGLQGDENVLEVGTGSGYQAAVLGYMAKTVHTVERIPSLAERAQRILREIGLNNVFVHLGDGSLGWQDAAPYQAIVVTAAAPQAPQSLLNQLTDGGRMVIPVGSKPDQELQVWQRNGDVFDYEVNIPVVFVPLRGEYGWKESLWQS
jgi:protein-L-isoaspartate(D-aspartate) O-methyltransferase